MKKTFAASGSLECVAIKGRRRLINRLTAQLTGKNDIVVTAEHGFLDPKTCERRMSPQQCTFRAHDGERMQTRSVQLVAKGEWRCDQADSKSIGLRRTADWAVLKLSAPITTITPYELGAVRSILVDTKALSVSAHSKDFRLGGKPSPSVKTIDDCNLKRSFYVGQQWIMQTNCDTAEGNSGGALLAIPSEGVPQVLGITVGFIAKGDSKKSRNVPDDGPYREAAWSSLAIALTGQFRTELEKAIGRPPSAPQVAFPTPDSRPIAFPAVTGQKPAFPSMSRPCEEGATTEECRKP